MTQEEVNSVRFKHNVYFTNDPRDGGVYLVRNTRFIAIVKVISQNHNDINTETLEIVSISESQRKVTLNRIKREHVSKVCTKKFKNKLGIFCLPKVVYPEYYL